MSSLLIKKLSLTTSYYTRPSRMWCGNGGKTLKNLSLPWLCHRTPYGSAVVDYTAFFCGCNRHCNSRRCSRKESADERPSGNRRGWAQSTNESGFLCLKHGGWCRNPRLRPTLVGLDGLVSVSWSLRSRGSRFWSRRCRRKDRKKLRTLGL